LEDPCPQPFTVVDEHRRVYQVEKVVAVAGFEGESCGNERLML